MSASLEKINKNFIKIHKDLELGNNIKKVEKCIKSQKMSTST